MKVRRVAVATVAGIATFGASLTFAAGLKESKKTVPIAFNEQKSVIAPCPGQTYAAWGGFKGTFEGNVSSGPNKVYTVGLVPEGPDADRFVVDADNGSPPSGADSKITSYAYCFEGKKPTVVSQGTNVPDEDIKGVAAECPDGKIVIGGGFETDFVNTQGPHITITFLGRGSGESFQAEIANVSGEGLNLTAYAVCGKGKAPKMYDRSAKLKNGDPKKVQSNCPDGDKLVFGGVQGEYDLATGLAMPIGMYEKGEGVEVMAAGDFGSKKQFTALAYCR